MKRKPIDERIEVVNGQLAVIHVYEPKPVKEEQEITCRDDSTTPYQVYKQREHWR